MGQLFFHAGGKRVFQLTAERKAVGFELDVDLERIVAVGELVRGQLLDTPTGPDPGEAVGPVHVLECPALGVNFQPAFQVADRIRQAVPR